MRRKCLLAGLALLLLAVSATAAVAETWGYDLPYSCAYGAGVPFYVGHNNGDLPGNIYENPALYPDGVAEPSVINGVPENALDLNFTRAFPNKAALTYGSLPGPFTFKNLRP